LEKATATLLHLGDRSRRDRGVVAAPQHVDPDAGRARTIYPLVAGRMPALGVGVDVSLRVGLGVGV
jgi:hypothetical protein